MLPCSYLAVVFTTVVRPQGVVRATGRKDAPAPINPVEDEANSLIRILSNLLW